MANGVTADEMTDLFLRVFHMVGGTFDCLCHGNYVNAVGASERHFRFQASHYDQIVQTVNLAVGAQDFQGAVMFPPPQFPSSLRVPHDRVITPAG